MRIDELEEEARDVKPGEFRGSTWDMWRISKLVSSSREEENWVCDDWARECDGRESW